MKRKSPSMDAWLKEAQNHETAPMVGMYLIHNGVVRQTPKAQVRGGAGQSKKVTGMILSVDREKADAAAKEAQKMEGICYIKIWLNEGELQVGDDLMFVLVGADIRPHAEKAMQYLVGCIKETCVIETEVSEA